MAQKRNPLLFLTDILKAIEKIEVHIHSGKQEFFENETIQDATLFRLQTIGEAVNQLPEELRERYPHIRWKDIVGFRNVLAHRYWRVDLGQAIAFVGGIGIGFTLLEEKYRHLSSIFSLIILAGFLIREWGGEIQ